MPKTTVLRRLPCLLLVITFVACSGSSKPISSGSAPVSDGGSTSPLPTDPAITSAPETTVPPPPLTAEEWFASGDDIEAADILPAFAALVGPVPDVVPMEIERSPGASLTALVNAALARYDTYTPDQQQALIALVSPSAEPAGLRAPERASIESDLQAVVDDLVLELNGLLGRTYPHAPPTVHYIDQLTLDDQGSFAIASASTWVPGSPLSSHSCDIAVGNFVSGRVLTVVREKLLHEVFHCFQYAFFDGTLAEFEALGRWRVEGTAAWVGLTAAGGTTVFGVDEWWRTYLAGHGDGAYALNVGWGYHAVGFWSFLEARRGGVWNLVLPQLQASSDAQAFLEVTGDDPGLMREWASSTTRSGWSSAWDTTGPGITGDGRVPTERTFTTGAGAIEISIQNLQNRVDRFTPSSDVEYSVVSVFGVGTSSFEGDAETAMVDRIARYCFLDDCLCPDGRPPFDGAPYVSVSSGPMTLGSGSLSTATPTRASVIGFTKQDVCRPCEGTGVALVGSGFGSSGFRAVEGECPDPCLNGKWLLDNDVVAAEFRRLTTTSFTSVEVTGATVWDFDRGDLVVSFGHAIVAVAPLEAGLVLTQTEEASGQISADYSALPGLLETRNHSSTAVLTSISDISGQAQVTTPTPIPGTALGVSASYECLGNVLTIRTAGDRAVTAVLERVTPGE